MAEPTLVAIPIPATPAQFTREDFPADLREGFTFLGALKGWVDRQPRFSKLSVLPAALRIVAAIEAAASEPELKLRVQDLKMICGYLRADETEGKPLEFVAPLTQMWRNADGNMGQRSVPAPNSLQALYVSTLFAALPEGEAP